MAMIVATCSDKKAFVRGPDGTLAVGAYSVLAYGGECFLKQGFVADNCNSDVSEVLELSSSDPSVVEIIDGKDHPAGSSAQYDHYLLGKSPGQSVIRFKGRFDDGSTREASTTVHVKMPDRLKVAPSCTEESSTTNLLTLVGTQESFFLEIYAGTESLAGWLPGAVTADGLTQEYFDVDDRNPYHWQAPSTPVVLQLQSAWALSIEGTLTAFGPDQVTDMTASGSVFQRGAFTEPGDFGISTHIRVQGQRTCQELPVELHSSTPAVCSGPAGETTWPGATGGGGAAVHAEGLCTLGFSMPGGPTLTTDNFPMFFVAAWPAGMTTPAIAEPCKLQAATACSPTYEDVTACKGGYWAIVTTCPADQICDFVPDTTAGCKAGTLCAQCRGLR